MKRKDYISWDQYFMGIAILSAQRSKDDHTQVGACLVNDHNKILSVGYNGMPTGCNDDDMPWEREGDPLHTKYFYVFNFFYFIYISKFGNIFNFNIVFLAFFC